MEGEVITLQDLLVYDKGIFSTMGIRPKLAERLRARGITLPADLFEMTSLAGARRDLDYARPRLTAAFA